MFAETIGYIHMIQFPKTKLSTYGFVRTTTVFFFDK